MAVNVSARRLDTDEFVTDVLNALSESELDPGALTLEITETTLMRNVEATARRLAAVRELGVRIAIDDFGTGYSSLAHLQQLPVDELKIDRSFISRLTQSPEGETLIHTLVQLGKALSIETLAEGIEQEQELLMLQEERCDSGQGFSLRPAPGHRRSRDVPKDLGRRRRSRLGGRFAAQREPRRHHARLIAAGSAIAHTVRPDPTAASPAEAHVKPTRS
jgi:EAL domain-containing protein (putative c-di-GMP-specific phosphodiesterase class I)